MTKQCNRREFLGQSLVVGGTLAAGIHLNSSSVSASSSSTEKLNIAAVGTANRAASDISGCSSENIVALSLLTQFYGKSFSA